MGQLLWVAGSVRFWSTGAGRRGPSGSGYAGLNGRGLPSAGCERVGTRRAHPGQSTFLPFAMLQLKRHPQENVDRSGRTGGRVRTVQVVYFASSTRVEETP